MDIVAQNNKTILVPANVGPLTVERVEEGSATAIQKGVADGPAVGSVAAGYAQHFRRAIYTTASPVPRGQAGTHCCSKCELYLYRRCYRALCDEP